MDELSCDATGPVKEWNMNTLASMSMPMTESSIDARYRIAELEERSKQQTLAMACSLISLLDLRDHYTGGHSNRVAKYCRATAVRLGMPDNTTETVVLAASLHDIGKVGVPDRVLL